MVRNELLLALTPSGNKMLQCLHSEVRRTDRTLNKTQATEMGQRVSKKKSTKKSYVPNSTVTFYCLPSYRDLSTDTNIVLKIGSSFPFRLAESTGVALFASC